VEDKKKKRRTKLEEKVLKHEKGLIGAGRKVLEKKDCREEI